VLNAALHEHLQECRRRGLVVDEDFERGISRRARAVYTAAIALFVIVLGAAALIAIGTKTADGFIPRRIHTTVRPMRNRLLRPSGSRTGLPGDRPSHSKHFDVILRKTVRVTA
jgi:hypothetical protein